MPNEYNKPDRGKIRIKVRDPEKMPLWKFSVQLFKEREW